MSFLRLVCSYVVSFPTFNRPYTSSHVSGPPTATPPPPPLLWGPGTTATSSPGSPATRPKVQLWTSECGTDAHVGFLSAFLFFFFFKFRPLSISSIQSHNGDWMDPFPWFLPSLLVSKLFARPVNRLKVGSLEREGAFDRRYSRCWSEMDSSLLRQKGAFAGVRASPWEADCADVHKVQLLNGSRGRRCPKTHERLRLATALTLVF